MNNTYAGSRNTHVIYNRYEHSSHRQYMDNTEIVETLYSSQVEKSNKKRSKLPYHQSKSIDRVMDPNVSNPWSLYIQKKAWNSS